MAEIKNVQSRRNMDGNRELSSLNGGKSKEEFQRSRHDYYRGSILEKEYVYRSGE